MKEKIPEETEVRKKYELLIRLLRQKERLAVAFSSGVDSAFLLYAAKQALGERVIALTAVSAFFSLRERTEAEAFCGEYGIRQIIVPFGPLEKEEIAENPKERCYFCKRALFECFLETARAQGFGKLCEGSNVDDLSDFRPGLRAIHEMGILSPLREAGLGKEEIRLLSKELGLSTWDKPSFACLASRIPYGQRITAESLSMVERAEEVLRTLGFSQYRVRVHGRLARIEVAEEQLPLLLEKDVRRSITKGFHEVGFSHVSADLDGYRTGSMNV